MSNFFFKFNKLIIFFNIGVKTLKFILFGMEGVYDILMLLKLSLF